MLNMLLERNDCLNKCLHLLLHMGGGYPLPPIIDGVTRAPKMKLLGVTLANDFSFSDHITEVLVTCARSLYAIHILKFHGLSSDSIHMVTKATTLSRLIYAAPAWYGYTLATNCARIEWLLLRLVRMDYLLKDCHNFLDLVYIYIWIGSFDSYQVLQSIFPPVLLRRPGLHKRYHPFILPLRDSKNFIPCVLYRSLLSHHTTEWPPESPAFHSDL